MTTTLDDEALHAHHGAHDEPHAMPGDGLSVDTMPAHWLMARLGKRVLRPGGRELTRWMIAAAGVAADDDVVELAPGLGATAQALLAAGPRRYVGVERDEAAVRFARARIAPIGHPDARVILGDASRCPLPDGSASLVVAEAMLSMQPPARKRAIVAEAARLLRPGGRYAIHELAVAGHDDGPDEVRCIERDLSRSIRVGVRIRPISEWRALLEAQGLEVLETEVAPMRLLEPGRVLDDEGAVGAARFAWNALREPRALRRLIGVRATFRVHAPRLRGLALIARRR